MVNNSILQKLSFYQQSKWIGYVTVFIIMMYNSGNRIFMNNYFLLLLSTYLVIYSRLWETINVKDIIYVLAVLLIYFIIATRVNVNYPNKYDITFIVRHLCYALVAFSVLKKMSFNFFFIYENIFFKLMAISLILFGIQLFKPDLILKIVSTVEKMIGFTGAKRNPAIIFHSMLIYTYNQINNSLPRNCGYLYEPGYYSIHIIIAFLISIIRSNLILNKKHIIYIVALISTVSTTGYLGFILLVAFYVFNLRNNNYRYLALIAAIPIVIYIISLPVVYEKILNNISSVHGWIVSARETIAEGGTNSLGRFAGAFFAYNAIKDVSPVFGIFRNYDILVGKFIIVSGFAEQLVSFGFFGLGLILFGLYKSTKILIEKNFNLKYSVFVFGIMVVSNFSYVFNMSLIFWIIYFYFLSEAKLKTYDLFQISLIKHFKYEKTEESYIT